MTTVLLKEMRKRWLAGILPPVILLLFIPMIAALWPTFQDQIAIFQEFLENPVYQAMLGHLGLGDISTWQGLYNMYIFVVLEMAMIFITMIIPARMITKEVDKRTLDITLSYPISRWRFILEKFGTYLIYNLLYPILFITVTIISNEVLNEEMNYVLLTYGFIGNWLLFFALGAISLLCGAIFLEGRKAIAAAGGIIVGMWILVRMGGIVESVNFLKYLSLFNYLNAAVIFTEGSMPIDELFIVIGVGLASLIGALVIFEKRELAIT
ncbi:MAG: ABC transporter permease subunit [Asgard group archaeon]|nr:ABC transporter permease subunit [Asgard group archaeon]